MKNIALLSVLLFLAFASPTSFAQPGSLDPSFGVGGKLVTTIPYASEFMVLSDGKLLVLGRVSINNGTDMAVYRLLADGSPDPTFGIHGRTAIDFDEPGEPFVTSDQESSIAILDNGDIMVAGTHKNSMVNIPRKLVLAKLHADGTPDENFGNAGKMSFVFDGFSANAKQIRKFANGDFLVWGELMTGSTSIVSHMALIRFKADGSIDTTFGPTGNGILIKPIAIASLLPQLRLYTLHITPDGKIVLLGGSFQGFSTSRYHSDGSDDLTFGTNGQTLINGLLGPQFSEMVVQADGKILSAGSAYLDGDPNFTLVRQNADGSLDQSFGSNGMVFDDLADYGCFIISMALQTDGKVVVVGTGEFGFNGTHKWMVARHQANGPLDTGFGTNGLVITNFGDAPAEPRDIVIDAQHAIYVGGYTGTGTNWAVAKYNPGFYTATKDLSARPTDLFAKVSPNLSIPGEAFSLNYQLPDNSAVSAQLLDTKGQIVQVFFLHETQTSGEQTKILRWREDLSAGFYILSLQTERGRAMLPVVLK